MDAADLVTKEEERQEAIASKARRQLAARHTLSVSHCIECGREIPPARQAAMPGVELCVQCQELEETGAKR